MGEGEDKPQCVKVAIRCRPPSQKEINNNEAGIVELREAFGPDAEPGEVVLNDPSGSEEPSQFAFDIVFGLGIQQVQVYESIGRPAILKTFEGYNGTIFAYGQTGSGKSWSMAGAGNGELRGITPRVNEELFDRIQEMIQSSTRRFLVMCSYFEIYNEIIFDLLNPVQDRSKLGGGLQIKEHPVMGIYVKDLTEIVAEDAKKLEDMLESGMKARAVSSTMMNSVSSRSHSVFTIKVHQKDEEDKSKNVFAKLNLVDLAGSERQKGTGASGQTLKEGANINKSLSALGNVINALVEQANGKKVFIPYRNSKLTRVLQESLGGNSLCSMLATLSPAACNYEETMSTLRYANRAKAIKVSATKNEEASQISRLKTEVEELKKKLANAGSGGVGGAAGLSEAEREQEKEKFDKQLKEMENMLSNNWSDKARLSEEHERKMQKVAEEQRKAAQAVEEERARRLRLLQEKNDLELSIRGLLDFITHLPKFDKPPPLLIGEQPRQWLKTLRTLRQEVDELKEQRTMVLVFKHAFDEDVRLVGEGAEANDMTTTSFGLNRCLPKLDKLRKGGEKLQQLEGQSLSSASELSEAVRQAIMEVEGFQAQLTQEAEEANNVEGANAEGSAGKAKSSALEEVRRMLALVKQQVQEKTDELEQLCSIEMGQTCDLVLQSSSFCMRDGGPAAEEAARNCEMLKAVLADPTLAALPAGMPAKPLREYLPTEVSDTPESTEAVLGQIIRWEGLCGGKTKKSASELLARPPPKFILDVTLAVKAATGFPADVDGEWPEEREERLARFRHIAETIGAVLGFVPDFDPTDVLRGKEVPKTLRLMQLLAVAAARQSPPVNHQAAGGARQGVARARELPSMLDTVGRCLQAAKAQVDAKKTESTAAAQGEQSLEERIAALERQLQEENMSRLRQEEALADAERQLQDSRSEMKKISNECELTEAVSPEQVELERQVQELLRDAKKWYEGHRSPSPPHTSSGAGAAGPSPHPLDTANWVVRVSLAWFSGLVALANQRPIRETDVWAAPRSHCPQVLTQALASVWDAEVAAAKLGKGQPSMARALLRTFWLDLSRAGMLLLLFTCSTLAQPFFIRRILHFLSESSSDSIGTGLAYAGAMLVLSILSSFLLAESSRRSQDNGLRGKAAATRIVFEQSLKLSAAARAVGSVGQTTNLMAVDTEKISMAMRFLHYAWVGPLATLFVGSLLTITIGPSALAGLALVILTWPLQLLLAKWGGQARRRAMASTDERVKFLTEIVRGIRVVKLCAWEDAVFSRASEARHAEVSWLSAALFLKSSTRECILMVLPPATLAVIFAIEHARGAVVDETLALMALGFLSTLRFPLNLFAFALAVCQDGLVSCSRLSNFLQRPRVLQERSLEAESALLDLSNTRFTWGSAGQVPSFQLHVPSLHLASPSRVAILGRVASGKTSLLAAMLGEMHLLHGRGTLRGRVAFMGQTPWIQNLSVRDNILFGCHLEEKSYWHAIGAAALGPDLEILKDGDLTEIGERGINLSGGQKARICLARCLYAVALGERDAVILDCPFDALDVATGQHVFDGMADITKGVLLICGMSAQVHLLPHFDKVVVVEDGCVTMDGDYATLAARYPELVQAGETVKEGTTLAPARTKRKSGKDAQVFAIQRKAKGSPSSLTRRDTNATGGISAKLMMAHLGEAVDGSITAGFSVGMALLLVFLVSMALRVAADILITEWGSGMAETGLALGILALCAVLLAARVGLTSVVSKRASTGLHQRALGHVLRAPVTEYFDITASGEIINKLAKDLETTDTMLPECCIQFLSNAAQLCTIVFLSSYAVPWFLAVLLALSALFLIICRRFVAPSRDLKRLDGSTRSPVYNCFSETLTGLDTIRAWQATGRFLGEFQRRHLHNLSFNHAVAMSEAWVMARLESISCLITGALALSAVVMRRSSDPRLVGLALVYVIQVTGMLQRTMSLVILISQQFASCERVRSFRQIPQEPAPVEVQDAKLPSDWPRGGVSFEDVQLRYRGGDLILKGVSFEAEPGERVGICGRTGAGKSTVLTALFRMAETCGGVVRVDGVDISKVGVRTLRSHMSIIPQDPVVFSGTLRSNLDPFGAKDSDQELLDVMRRVGLGDLARSKGLDGCVAENGENLSQGQRQLLCIARVMLRSARVTALDEATSAMDAETDRAVQRALAEHWRAAAGNGGTMLTIAHRLSTILEYDRILVLSFGKVAEFDTPARLLARSDGAISTMLRDEPSAV